MLASALATQALESTLEKTIEREKEVSPITSCSCHGTWSCAAGGGGTNDCTDNARARPQLKSAHVPPRVFILVNSWANWRDDKLAWNVRDILSRDKTLRGLKRMVQKRDVAGF